ncbi:MAG: CAP domain-containing protein [Muricomes sp.]
MKHKLLPALLAVAVVGTAAVSPLSVHAASPSNAFCQLQGRTIYLNGSNANELKQKLESLGINCEIPTWNNCPVPEQPSTNQPETPSQPETNQPETPSQPETNQPQTPSQPETNQPQTPSQPETPSNPGTSQPDTSNKNAAYIQQVVDLVNKERAKAGLSPVKADATIQSAAQVRAKEIEKSFAHTRPDGSSFSTALTQKGVKYQGAGENIAWGQKSPEQVMNGWMNSAGHRANILNAKYTKIGVGCYQNASGTLYWTQLFTY